MFPSEGVELQMGLSSVRDLLESHAIQLATRTFKAFCYLPLSRFIIITALRQRALKQCTGLKTWMSWFLETKWELLAMHVAVSSLSPVSIQIWAEGHHDHFKIHLTLSIIIVSSHPKFDHHHNHYLCHVISIVLFFTLTDGNLFVFLQKAALTKAKQFPPGIDVVYIMITLNQYWCV